MYHTIFIFFHIIISYMNLYFVVYNTKYNIYKYWLFIIICICKICVILHIYMLYALHTPLACNMFITVGLLITTPFKFKKQYKSHPSLAHNHTRGFLNLFKFFFFLEEEKPSCIYVEHRRTQNERKVKWPTKLIPKEKHIFSFMRTIDNSFNIRIYTHHHHVCKI